MFDILEADSSLGVHNKDLNISFFSVVSLKHMQLPRTTVSQQLPMPSLLQIVNLISAKIGNWYPRSASIGYARISV